MGETGKNHTNIKYSDKKKPYFRLDDENKRDDKQEQKIENQIYLDREKKREKERKLEKNTREKNERLLSWKKRFIFGVFLSGCHTQPLFWVLKGFVIVACIYAI